MANTDLIAPLVVAAIGLLGTLFSLYWNYASEKRAKGRDIEMAHMNSRLTKGEEEYKAELEKHQVEFEANLEQKQIVADLMDKYGQPLLVAAYDLQQRLFELVEYPISRQHLTTQQGLDDLKIFTCFLLAQYLGFVHILRTKTAYMSFTGDGRLQHLRSLLYRMDEELDRRRDAAGRNVGVWPASRVLVSERMIVKASGETASPDGRFGVEVKGYGDFYNEWSENFREPMGYFCEWLDLMLEARLSRSEHDVGNDAPMRCLQHMLVDLVDFLDTHNAYIAGGTELLKCKKSIIFCDCEDSKCYGPNKSVFALQERRDSRWGDAGLWSVKGLRPSRPWNPKDPYDDGSDKKISLKEVKAMTHTVNLNFDK